jgi:hypothetical protein
VTLDAGSQMDHYKVYFKPAAAGTELTAAVGLKKVKGETVDFDAAGGILAIWEPVEKNQGMQGLGIIVDPKNFVKQADDKLNNLLVIKTEPDNSIDYWAGFAWDKAGKIISADDWRKYTSTFAQIVRSPVEVTVSAQ